MSKRSTEYGGEPELKRQRDDYDSLHHLTKVVRDVLTNNVLRKHIMNKVSEIHNTILSEYDRTATGKQLDISACLSDLASFGATRWCAKEYLGMVELTSSLNNSLLKSHTVHLTMIRESIESYYFKSLTQKNLFKKLVDPTYTASSAVKEETNEKEKQYDESIKWRSKDYLIAMSRPHDQLDELVSILNAAKFDDNQNSSSSHGELKSIPILFKDRIGDKLWEDAVINIIKTHGKHYDHFFPMNITEVAAFCAAPKLAHIAIKARRFGGWSNCDAIRGDRWDSCQQCKYVSLLKYCTPGNDIYNPLREMVLEKCFRVKRRSHRNSHDEKEKLPYHYFEHASVDGIIELFRLTYVRGADLVITATVLPSLKNALIIGNLEIVNFIIDYINNDYAHIKMTNDNAKNDIKEEERARERRRLRDIDRSHHNNKQEDDDDSPPTHIDEVNEEILSVDLIDRLLECEALSNMFKCTFKKVLECSVKKGNPKVAAHLISIAHAHEFQFDYQRVFELCFESRNDTSRIVSLMIRMNLAHPNDVPEEIHQNISKEVAMTLACSKPTPPLNADIVQMCIRHGEDVMEVLCTNGHIRDDIEFVNDRNMIVETFGISFKMFSMFRLAAPVLARMEHEDDLDVIPICLRLSMERGDQECIDHIIENHRDVLTDKTIHECMNHLLTESSIDTIKKYVEMFGKFKLDQDATIRAAKNNNEDVMMYILAWEPSPENIHTAIMAAMHFSKYNIVIRIIDTYGNQYPDKVSGALGYEKSLSQVYDSKFIEYIFTSPNSPYINGCHTSTFTSRMINQLFDIALNQTNYKITKVLDKINSNRVTPQLISNLKKVSVDNIINNSMSIDIESTPNRMDQVFHQVFRDSKLSTMIIEQITVIHEILGCNFIKMLDNGDKWFSNDKKEYNVTKGRIVYNSKSLITFIKFGCTQWFIEEYEKLCSFEMYPYNDHLLETAINYKNTTIIDKLLPNPNIILKNFNGMWTDSMLELGYHDGLIQEFKMTRPIKHQSLINALSSGSLQLIKYLVDNKMVLSEEESKENDGDENNNDNHFGGIHRYRSHNDKSNEHKLISHPSMYDMVLLIKQHGLCTGTVQLTLLEFAYIHQVPQSLFELLYQGVKPNNFIIEFILRKYQPEKTSHLLKYLNTQENNQGDGKEEIHTDGEDHFEHESESDDTSNQPISQDNFKSLLMKVVDNGPSEMIDWAMSKCSSTLQNHDWVQLFKLALKNGNHELLQIAYTKCGQIRQQELYDDHYLSVSHIKIHPNMLKHEVFIKMGMSLCNPHIINSALDNDREDIIQEALNNPEHLNKSCECFKDTSSGCNTSMLLNAIRRGRRDVVDWVHNHHKQKRYGCSCPNMGFEESLKNGDLEIANLFVDDLSNHFNHGCGSAYNYISGCAKNLGKMELSDLGKVTIGQLIAATKFKDTSITEDLIISVLESGVKIASGAYGHTYLTDANSAYELGLMRLVRCILKDKNEVHPIKVTRGYPPNVNNNEAIEYYIQSLINVPNENVDIFGYILDTKFTFDNFFKLFNLTLKKYGLIQDNDPFGREQKSSRECPTHQLESLRTDQLNDYKKCISILHQLNENNQTVDITKSDIKTLIMDHFELVPMIIRDDILWTSCLQPSKNFMIKASFHQTVSEFNIEGIKFFWNYMNEIKSSSPTLHKQIGILYPFDNQQYYDIKHKAVYNNQYEFMNVVFNYPHSPLYHKQYFDNNNKDSTVNQYLNEKVMKQIKNEAYQYGNIHIINMCNTIINYFNRDIQTN